MSAADYCAAASGLSTAAGTGTGRTGAAGAADHGLGSGRNAAPALPSGRHRHLQKGAAASHSSCSFVLFVALSTTQKRSSHRSVTTHRGTSPLRLSEDVRHLRTLGCSHYCIWFFLSCPSLSLYTDAAPRLLEREAQSRTQALGDHAREALKHRHPRRTRDAQGTLQQIPYFVSVRSIFIHFRARLSSSPSCPCRRCTRGLRWPKTRRRLWKCH